jgi:predicted enzyme related to lactoylglutathione lyase
MQTQARPEIREIAFTAYPAKDVKSLREWYENMLGLKFDGPYEQDGVEQYNQANVSGGYFSLMNHDWMETPPGTGVGVAFEVADMDAAVSALRGNGVAVADIYDTPVCRVTTFKDGEGNKVTLHQITVPH